MPTQTLIEERAVTALQTLCHVTHTKITALACILGVSRQSANDKYRGKVPLNLRDFDKLTAHFEIPPAVLFMERAELLTWMGSSGWSDQPGRIFACKHDLPVAA